MSDLAAANCQTSCDNSCGCNLCNGNSIIWILLLLCLCGNGGSSFGRGGDCNSCDSLIWILILLSCCNGGGNSGFGCGCGC